MPNGMRSFVLRHIGNRSNIIVRWLVRRTVVIMRHVAYYSGCEFVYRKFVPTRASDRLPTGFIWLVGLYAAFYGIVSQRYENRVDIIETRANAVLMLLVTPETRMSAINQIASVQRMSCPERPEVIRPIYTVKSLFGRTTYHQETVELLKRTLVDFKSTLGGAALDEADLQGAELPEANLEGAVLTNADLREANLQIANLREAGLWGADLRGADLSEATLDGAILVRARLDGAKGLTVKQLSQVYSLFGATVDSDLRNHLAGEQPALFEQPKPRVRSQTTSDR